MLPAADSKRSHRLPYALRVFKTGPQICGARKENDMEKKNDKDEYEAKEALHRKEWEEKQAQKKADEQAELDAIRSLSDEDVISQSLRRVSEDTDRITRRNMKECVSEYVQTLSLSDLNFARNTLYPKKNMRNCFRFIIRKAREYLETEGSLDTEEPLEAGSPGSRRPGPQVRTLYGDVPDDLCYAWAEEYFRSSDIKEDQEKEDVYVPLPRPAGSRQPGRKTSAGKKTSEDSDNPSVTEASEKKAECISTKKDENVQLSLFDMETEVPNEEKLSA